MLIDVGYRVPALYIRSRTREAYDMQNYKHILHVTLFFATVAILRHYASQSLPCLAKTCYELFEFLQICWLYAVTA